MNSAFTRICGFVQTGDMPFYKFTVKNSKLAKMEKKDINPRQNADVNCHII